MTKAQQKQFVKELSQTITTEICKSIDAGKTPDTWDGHELRVLLAEHHHDSASMTVIRERPRSSRARNYRNTVAINYL